MHVVGTGRLVRAVAAAALGVAALVVVGASPGQAAAVPCQRSFSSSTSSPISPAIPFPVPPYIPLPGFGTSTVDVPDGGIADVDVTVHITDPSVDGLTLSVQHGTTTVLLKSAGLPGADMAGTTFDDEATQSVTTAAPPYSGLFQPASPLSAFDGSSALGTWTLNVSNMSYTTGTIDSWSVAVTYSGTCNNDSDAVEDHSDSCLGLAGQTTSGCPLATRTLTAKYRHGKFKGALASSAAACRSPQSVTIWKVRPGPDRRIGTRTTGSDGSYKLRRARRAGKYYATSPRVVVSNIAECPATTSPRFRLR